MRSGWHGRTLEAPLRLPTEPILLLLRPTSHRLHDGRRPHESAHRTPVVRAANRFTAQRTCIKRKQSGCCATPFHSPAPDASYEAMQASLHGRRSLWVFLHLEWECTVPYAPQTPHSINSRYTLLRTWAGLAPGLALRGMHSLRH